MRDMQIIQIYDGWARPSQRGKRRPHPAGRQDPTDKQRPSPGRQRPLPARAPTRTSRRAGIGQGDLPHSKVTTSSLRMQGDRKEQHSSHSLNKWKERFDLWHRHAGKLTGSEPYKLRGILNKEPQSLMTRLGPSHDEGPGTQPTNSKWSFQFVYVTSNITMCSIERRTKLWSRQCIQSTHVSYSVSIDRAVAQDYLCI